MPEAERARDAASAVAAVLAVTPIHPEHHDALIGWRQDESRDEYWPTYGDPTPIAARQAAAVYRAIAEHLESQQTAPNKIRLVDAVWLRKRADEIDGGTDGQ